MYKKRLFQDYFIFIIAFLIIFIVAKTFIKGFEISNIQFILIAILAFFNMLAKEFLEIWRDKNSINQRNFDLIRRLVFIGFIAMYFYIYNNIS